MKEYLTPDFDVTVYEIEDIITAGGSIAIGPADPDGDGWEKL